MSSLPFVRTSKPTSSWGLPPSAQTREKLSGTPTSCKTTDTAEILKIATQHGLYDEVFMVYEKYEDRG
jgi:hypothetical protein